MTNSIISVPTTRISGSFIRSQLVSQLQINAANLFRSELELSTGHSFQSIGEEPVSALQVVSLQSLLERKNQVKSNIQTNQSFLSATDTALSSVSDLITQIRATAVGVTGDSATDVQRSAAAQQVEQTIQQLMNIGNQQYAGRYLFAGSESATQPFQSQGNAVQYSGNQQNLASYADLNLLFDTNINGNKAFGAISSQVQGNVKITPTLTYDTPLADLLQGQGISKGSIAISDGTNTSVIDLNSANTVGDLAALIHHYPPQGSEVNVDITADKIVIQLVKQGGGGNLSIRDVGGGTMAQELGIRRDKGVGADPISSYSLEPTLDNTTSLQNILGAYAGTTIHSSGNDNDIRIAAESMGAATNTGVPLNGVSITLLNDSSLSPGDKPIVDPPDATNTIKVHIVNGFTKAIDVVDAINLAHNNGKISFTAGLDPLDEVNGGQGLVEDGATAITADGSGKALDQQSGLQITNGGQVFNIDLSGCKTVEDVLNAVNANSGLLAEINATKDGINIRSRDSGADFMIAENGGTTAAQLGLRTFTEDTSLDDLNFGEGVGELSTSSPAGSDDFTIVRSDGVELKINIAGAKTIGDVINLINGNVNNGDGKLIARLRTHGNGIELIDNSTGAGELSVVPNEFSNAAVDLGLVPQGQKQSNSAALTYTTELISKDSAHTPVPKSAIIITTTDKSVALSGLQVVLDKMATGVTYDEVNKTLTVGIDPHGNTDANGVIDMINGSEYASTFHAALDPAGGNDGTGKVVDGTSGIMYGAKLTSMIASTPVPNTGVIVSAANTSDNLNGVQVVLDSTVTGVKYNEDKKILTVGIDPLGTTDANGVVDLINKSDYHDMFQAALDPIGGNDGTWKVVDGTSATITAASTLEGADVNEKETEGIFTALIRLKQALQNNDSAEIGRAIGVLDKSTQNMNFARAELGIRQQGLDVIQSRLDTENTQIQSDLSNKYDADITQVVSDLAAQQTAYQAALKATASILQMSLLNYL